MRARLSLRPAISFQLPWCCLVIFTLTPPVVPRCTLSRLALPEEAAATLRCTSAQASCPLQSTALDSQLGLSTSGCKRQVAHLFVHLIHGPEVASDIGQIDVGLDYMLHLATGCCQDPLHVLESRTLEQWKDQSSSSEYPYGSAHGLRLHSAFDNLEIIGAADVPANEDEPLRNGCLALCLQSALILRE